MTPEEVEVSRCLDKVFEYCLKHEGSCKGCIFFKYVQLGNVGFSMCKVRYAPEIFGESRRGEDED